MLQLLD
jgi:hypothetical protein